MSHYKHLTPKEREKILLLYEKNCSISYIAEAIGRNKSTVSRELSRNCINGIYSAVTAQNNYEKRRRKCRPEYKLKNPLIYAYVRDKFLEHQWSPEQISERLKLEKAAYSISYSTIYRGIYAGMFDTAEQRKSQGNRGAIRKLRHRGKTRHTKGHVETRGKIVISNPIEVRPTLHSITPDRGKEFAHHCEITEALNGVDFYFPQPHQPWKRGTNENTNGLLREYFPKGDDLSRYSDEYIQSKVDELNKRPRKCLNYLTPYEVYYSLSLHLT